MAERQNDKHTCILCGEKIRSNYTYCKDCYYNVQDRTLELNEQNQSPIKLRDYYYNAKDYALRTNDENKVYYQKLTMSAIANLLVEINDDDDLKCRLEKDLKVIDKTIAEKQQRLQTKEKVYVETKEQPNKRTQDGHYVMSDLEVRVDDTIYSLGYAHAYDIKVAEITERAVQCDWYIPVTFTDGIYIELWGVKNDGKYERNKKEKIELYQKHKLQLIQIEYDEAKNDTSRLMSMLKARIKEEINEIKKQ